MIKIGTWLNEIYGKQAKNRWKKIIGSIAFLVFVFGITWMMLFNVSYNKKDGFELNPTDPSKLKGK